MPHPARLVLFLLATVLSLTVGSAGASAPAGVTPASPGDLTCNHQVDGQDTLALATHIAGLSPSTHPACPAIGSIRNPSNGKIAYGSVDGDIIVMDADGGNLVNITNSPADDQTPSWSPDGKFLIFASNREDSHYQLYLMTAAGAGAGVARLTHSTFNDSTPQWSPDGQQIVFDSFNGARTDVFMMNADGSNRHNITTGNPGDDFAASWSPDGQRLVFSSDRDGNYVDIYTMDPDGTNVTPLVQDHHYSSSPSWSPDGTTIAFHEYNLTDTDTFVVPAAGGLPVDLTNAPGRDSEPSWSPDGAFILFTSERNDPDPTNCDTCREEIYRMDPDGGNPVRLTDAPAEKYAPKWQPIGDIFGDLNCDDVIDVDDLVVSLRDIADLPLDLPLGCPSPS